MKRDILCLKCAGKLTFVKSKGKPLASGIIYKPYPDEYLKLTYGVALADYVCDSCGQGIKAELLCAAYSLWSDRIPYLPWEEDYIKPVTQADVDLARAAAKRILSKT
jgi:hypothetical protein